MGRARRYSTTALDSLLGLLLLAVYIVGIVGLAGLITWVTIKIFPTKDSPGKTPKPDEPAKDGDGPAGRLFRKAKRETA